MEYIDEEIIELRKQQKKEKYHSLETGIYVQNELLEFEQTELLNGNISIILPKTFVTMPPNIAKIKYTSEFRPQEIKTSLDVTVNFAFNYIDTPLQPDETKSASYQLEMIIKRMNPACIFFERNTETVNDLTFSWFDYKSSAMDATIYNYVFVSSIGKKLLHGAMNCPFESCEDWKQIANQVMHSIKDLTKEKERIL